MSIGIWQLVLVLAIVLILFGSGKLPQVMSDIGRGIGNLRRAIDGSQSENERDKSGQGSVGDTKGPTEDI